MRVGVGNAARVRETGGLDPLPFVLPLYTSHKLHEASNWFLKLKNSFSWLSHKAKATMQWKIHTRATLTDRISWTEEIGNLYLSSSPSLLHSRF